MQRKSSIASLDVSVVIPVFNEEDNMISLCGRVLDTMKATGKKYEIIFVDDGSTDGSLTILKEAFELYPDVVRIITFNGNYGQYVAILAGFEHVRGEVIVTLDADLQNLPDGWRPVL
ncbi:hypothetical protein FACS1894122_14970 [Alphaproteobacteria bacterium]|nr:hypothetical protein FACS1894122_14970 [Alphaproteobacteria bacterium]